MKNDISYDIWSDIAKKSTRKLRSFMCANYDADTNFYPHSELRYLDSSKKYKILDFGCGDGRNLSYLRSFAHTIHGYDVEGLRERNTGYDAFFSSLDELHDDYDIVIATFVFQFLYSPEILSDTLEVLSKKASHLYVISRITMEDGSNVFKLLFENKSWGLELGDGQDLGFLVNTNNINVHFEQVYTSKNKVSKITPHIGFDIHQNGNWIYKSYANAASDLREFAKTLPPLSGVCGVPRSGVALAGMLAHILNTKYYSIESLRNIVNLPDETTSFRPNNCRPITSNTGPILVLDDTCWSGYALANTKKYLSTCTEYDLVYGALYISNHAFYSKFVDFHYQVFPTVNHTFEWNIMRDPLSQKYIVDFDGVLCEDWVLTEEMEDTDIYRQHLLECKPLYKPNYPLYKIVTARLEKFRPETEEWLRRHGIVYGELIMSPYNTRQERAANDGFIGHKANHYLNDNYAICFVESNSEQALGIYQRTGKPVFCVDTMTPYGNLKL